ncbi:MAG: hypothetical protein R3C53_14020 [Pirellulaceae bacterium]
MPRCKVKLKDILSRAVFLCTLIACGWWTPQAASAAGCNYDHSSQQLTSQPGRFAEGRWWATGPVYCVYEYGEFKYYQVPTPSLPCNAPGCRGNTPQDSFQNAANVELQRQSPALHRSSRAPQQMAPLGPLVRADDHAPLSPVLECLLRPPRA